MTTFASLPIGTAFEFEGARWIKTDVQRAKPDNDHGQSCLFFGPAAVKKVARPSFQEDRAEG